MITINKDIKNKKNELLDYYRNRAQELLTELRQTFSDTEYKERASGVNKGLLEIKQTLIKNLEQEAKKDNWEPQDLLESVLMITYTSYIVMLETRNEVWPYEFMSFSRRIGELWEPFCQLCWDYPVNKEISFFIPPLFKEVKQKLVRDIEAFIENLKISTEEKEQLKSYYRKAWMLVTSGEIKLECDLHFQDDKFRYVVDFKSGFSSNEKGNTNRLLLVASVYKILEENFKTMIFVRSTEAQSNHYLQTLKNSGLWEVYAGAECYEQIGRITKFDLSNWMKKNVKWEDDFDKKMSAYVQDNNLTQYLEW